MKGNKTGGRVQGTPNKFTTDLRAKINTIVEKQIDNIEKDLEALDPKERLQIVEKLISYCVPKLAAQTIEIDLNNLSETQIDEIINSININENEVE